MSKWTLLKQSLLFHIEDWLCIRSGTLQFSFAAENIWKFRSQSFDDLFSGLLFFSWKNVFKAICSFFHLLHKLWYTVFAFAFGFKYLRTSLMIFSSTQEQLNSTLFSYTVDVIFKANSLILVSSFPDIRKHCLMLIL